MGLKQHKSEKSSAIMRPPFISVEETDEGILIESKSVDGHVFLINLVILGVIAFLWVAATPMASGYAGYLGEYALWQMLALAPMAYTLWNIIGAFFNRKYIEVGRHAIVAGEGPFKIKGRRQSLRRKGIGSYYIDKEQSLTRTQHRVVAFITGGHWTVVYQHSSIEAVNYVHSQLEVVMQKRLKASRKRSSERGQARGDDDQVALESLITLGDD